MARPTKQGLDYFPLWNPQKSTLSKFSRDFRTRYKAIRNSSSGFIQRKDVREIILKKCNYMCSNCSSIEGLQIDHIQSVYLAAKGLIDIYKLNTYDNLTVLCVKCNCGKTPN